VNKNSFGFFKLELFKNITILTSGTLVAQLIPILLQPVLRRLFVPEVFGNFAIYLSATGVIAIAVSFRYEMTIVLPKKDADAANLLVLAMMINIVISFLFCLVLLFWKEEAVRLLNLSPPYISWLYFIPLSVFLFAGYQAINYWLIRQKAYRRSSGNKILRRATEASVQVAGGLLHRSSAMVTGDISGNLVNLLAGLLQLKKTRFTLRYISLRRMRAMALRYREFPLYNLFPSFLNTAAALAPVFFIKHFFSDNVTGYFDLTRTVLAIPMALLTVSVSQVLYQKISERRNRGEGIRDQMLPLMKVLGVLAVAEVIVLFFFGKELFAFFFGKTWGVSGEYARILVFGFALKFIVSPLSVSLMALEKIRVWSLWQILYFIAICSLAAFKAPDIDSFLIRYLIIDIFAYTVYAGIIFFVIAGYEKEIRTFRDSG